MKEQKNFSETAAEYLQGKGIYAVRQMARALGVPKTATYKKTELIEIILQKAAETNWAECKTENISAETAADLQTLQKTVRE